MSKKNKFDLTNLVHHGKVTDGETLYFVSNPQFTATVVKILNGEYKLKVKADILTVHGAAQLFLGQEPPEHASRWLRTKSNKTLYELWQLDLEERKAA